MTADAARDRLDGPNSKRLSSYAKALASDRPLGSTYCSMDSISKSRGCVAVEGDRMVLSDKGCNSGVVFAVRLFKSRDPVRFAKTGRGSGTVAAWLDAEARKLVGRICDGEVSIAGSSGTGVNAKRSLRKEKSGLG